MTDVEYKNLELDYRMYQYIRNNAITNLYDACVELLTNAVDAYSSLEVSPKKIYLNFSPETRNLVIYDNAIGLTGERMEVAFLTVGTYLSDEQKRGHFSRGAKDISAIANVTFTAIKDGLLSQCKILSNGTGALLVKNRSVTNEERNLYYIPENGLHVNLDLISTLDLELDFNKLKRHYALRDILSTNNIEVLINNNFVLKYQAPNVEKIVGVEYEVPYYNVPAKFEVWIDRNQNLYLDNNQKFTENGFLIKSFNTIYENSTLNSRFISRHPKFEMLTGILKCDYINTLLKDYETNGPSERNPIPIIDTSRLVGLNVNHPFTKHLLRLPQERVTYILTELQYESNNKNKNINLAELMASLDDLRILGQEIFDKLNIELISDLYISGEEKPLPDIQHTGEEEDLPFSRERIRNRRERQKKEAENLLKSAAKLDINFTDKNFTGKFEYSVNNQGIRINIPLTNSVVKRYLGDENQGYPGKNDTRFLIALSDIITESFTEILTDNEMAQTDTTKLTPQEIVDLYNMNYATFYDLYEDKVYDIILG
jgi:hypothetical protein